MYLFQTIFIDFHPVPKQLYITAFDILFFFQFQTFTELIRKLAAYEVAMRLSLIKSPGQNKLI